MNNATETGNAGLDHWLVPNTCQAPKTWSWLGRRTAAMHRPLEELVEEFCMYQGKVSGKTEGGVRAYGWTLQQYLKFVQMAEGRPATIDDLTPGRSPMLAG